MPSICLLMSSNHEPMWCSCRRAHADPTSSHVRHKAPTMMVAVFSFSVLGRAMLNRRSHSSCTVSSKEGGTALASDVLLSSAGGGGLTVGAIHLGSLEQHTTFEAELVSNLLGLWLAGREPDADSASLKADSQVAIQALHTHKPGPGSYLLDEYMS